MYCSLPDSNVHGIFQARVLEWVAIFFSRGFSWPSDRTQVSCTTGRCLTIWATRCKTSAVICLIPFQSLVLLSRISLFQSTLLLFTHSVMSDTGDPMDCGLPASSVHGISQARILDQVAISFCRGSSQSRDRTCISCFGRWILYHWATREVLSKWLAISFGCYPLYFNKYAYTDVSLILDRIHLLALASYQQHLFCNPY